MKVGFLLSLDCRYLSLRQNGFEKVRQKGSHIIMQLRMGTLLGIIRQSELPRSLFQVNAELRDASRKISEFFFQKRILDTRLVRYVRFAHLMRQGKFLCQTVVTCLI
jgi:hypothetical protein